MRIRNKYELRNDIKKKQIERLEPSQRREMRCKKKRRKKRKKKGTKLRVFRLRIHVETPAPFTVNGKDI
jgi:hypothetical protein